MAVGYQISKGVLDNKAGNLTRQLRDSFNEIQRFKTWLDGKSDNDLLTYGYASEDVTLLRAAFFDLDKLAQVARGQATQPGASNFFFWSGQLIGVE